MSDKLYNMLVDLITKEINYNNERAEFCDQMFNNNKYIGDSDVAYSWKELRDNYLVKSSDFELILVYISAKIRG